ncbi:integrase DNA-binding domain-containing protein, partial [Clostridioides difficile]
VYKYTDIYGKPQFIYSWKLVPTDKTPAGKRDDISLREKEAQIPNLGYLMILCHYLGTILVGLFFRNYGNENLPKTKLDLKTNIK